MTTVAYLANEFPSTVEPYVVQEIEELRRRGARVVEGSVRRVGTENTNSALQCAPEVVLLPLQSVVFLKAGWLCVRRWKRISPLVARVLLHGSENVRQRVKALVHTFLGACYAVMLEGRGVEHIHVHHGYFGSQVAMTAAHLLDLGFSMTLHGSDLLLHGTYLDVKLKECTFCLTVSEYNRGYILEHYPEVEPRKVMVARLGVEVPQRLPDPASKTKAGDNPFTLLTVGRLHAVKDHAFLVRACARLHSQGLNFTCFLAGDGPERRHLESLIRKYGLDQRITLLGHIPREEMDSLYDRADIVVLTSRSEGIPLVLMEAMARGKIVLAPAITGIPELVINEKTGFLYEPGSLPDFVARLLTIHCLMQAQGSIDRHHFHPQIAAAASQLDMIRRAARAHVRHNFNRKTNLASVADLFLEQAAPQTESLPDENLVLQQI